MDNNNLFQENINSNQANLAQFSIDVNVEMKLNLSVFSFNLSDNTLSSDFNLSIELKSDNPLDVEKLLGQRATFTLHRSIEDITIIGVIVSIDFTGTGIEVNKYKFVMRSILNKLNYSHGNYIYLNKDVKDVISNILIRSGIETKDFELKLANSYRCCEFTVQHDETNYNFLSRVISYYGIFYNFKYINNTAKVIFYDTSDDLPLLSSSGIIMYNAETGTVNNSETIFSLYESVELLPKSVQIKDYNYRMPEIPIDSIKLNTSNIESIGEKYFYGLKSYDTESNDRLIQIITESINWKQRVHFAESDYRGLFPGCRFTLEHHPNPRCNIEFLVVSVNQTGDQKGAYAMSSSGIKSTYRNKLLLIPHGTPYRSAFINKPKINGIFTAIVESSGGEYAHLDEQGRYKIKFSSDLLETSEGESSHPVRLMQSYSGNNYGSHFPLHSGTEVVVSCVNGDPDRPVLLGTLPNPNTISPVSSSNNTQNILRSWAGNELLLDDLKGSENIKLFTKDKNNILKLDASKAGHKVELKSQQGEMNLFSAKTFVMESGDSQTFQVGNNYVATIENKQQLMTKNKQIEFTAATNVQFTAGENILIESEKDNIEVTAGKDLILDVDSDMSIEVHNKNIDLNVSNGDVNISAAKSITVKGQGGGKIHIGQSGSSINISKSGDLTINGKTVNINGISINITGNSISKN